MRTREAEKKDRLVGIRDVAPRLNYTVSGLRQRLQRSRAFVPAPCAGPKPCWLWRESDITRFIASIQPGNDLDRARSRQW